MRKLIDEETCNQIYSVVRSDLIVPAFKNVLINALVFGFYYRHKDHGIIHYAKPGSFYLTNYGHIIISDHDLGWFHYGKTWHLEKNGIKENFVE